jgi:hypothetical protein
VQAGRFFSFDAGKDQSGAGRRVHIDILIGKFDDQAEVFMTIDAQAPCSDAAACALWNPSAAASWSLLFTPAFGAFIHMRNWQALGQPAQAASARKWFYASLALLMLQVCTRALNARLGTEPLLLHPAGLLFLLVWYFGAARSQALLVRARYGASYRRKRWDSVLMAAVMAGTAHAIAGALLSACTCAPGMAHGSVFGLCLYPSKTDPERT